MKENLILSEIQVQAFEKALEVLSIPVEPVKINHVLELFLSDEALLGYLKMSKKSLYNYRQEGYFSQIALPGRSYTYLPYLLKDLLELNQKRERKGRREQP